MSRTGWTTTRARARCLGAAAPALWLLACAAQEDAPELWTASHALEDRRVLASDIQELWHLGGTLQDTLLSLPLFLQADTGLVLVFDDGARRLIALDAHTGEIRWTFGRQGGGPDEFVSVRDVRIDADGRIAVLDQANARVLLLDREGKPLHHVRLAHPSLALHVVPLSADRLLLVTDDPREPLVVIDTSGTVVQRHPFAWDGFGRLRLMARQGTVASAGTDWAYAFLFGNGWFPYRGVTPLGPIGRYLEHQEFVRPVTRRSGNVTQTLMPFQPCAACSASLNDGILYVYSARRGPQRPPYVDLFRWETTEYLGSIVYPRSVQSIVVSGELAYVLWHTPVPRLSAVKLTIPDLAL
jgi:hypothetical protein